MVLGAIGQALPAVLVYLIPAVSLVFLLRGLSEGRGDNWPVPEVAERWKREHRRWTWYARRLHHGLAAIYAAHIVALIALATEGCAPDRSHLAAAAQNLTRATDLLWLIGFTVLAIGALAGALFAVLYAVKARRERWRDPRARDQLVIHVALVPLALLLLFAAFGATARFLCGP